MKTTYEVNANGNRTYSSDSAAKVANVAAAWSKQGHEPKAYAKIIGEKVRVEEVTVSTAAKTKAALKAAK